jgi:hypothetical protein
MPRTTTPLARPRGCRVRSRCDKMLHQGVCLDRVGDRGDVAYIMHGGVLASSQRCRQLGRSMCPRSRRRWCEQTCNAGRWGVRKAVQRASCVYPATNRLTRSGSARARVLLPSNNPFFNFTAQPSPPKSSNAALPRRSTYRNHRTRTEEGG